MSTASTAPAANTARPARISASIVTMLVVKLLPSSRLAIRLGNWRSSTAVWSGSMTSTVPAARLGVVTTGTFQSEGGDGSRATADTLLRSELARSGRILPLSHSGKSPIARPARLPENRSVS